MRTLSRLGLLSLVCCSAGPLLAQNASVSGQVLDSTGAVVEGAVVTLTRPSTQVKVSTVSDARGIFIFPPVAPGNYSATVTAPGFKAWTQNALTLEVGGKGVLSPVLVLGSVSETVTVSGAPPELNVDNVERSTVTEAQLVASIPLDVRNPFQETAFSVGVTQSNSLTAGTNLTTQSTTNTFYINGVKPGDSEILIDGAANTVNYDTHAAGAIPGLDAVREFRIYTIAYSPEYGRTGGGIESFGIKSGTNTLHGGGWYYFRNQNFDANGYNANKAGQARPNFQRNQFGGQIGGPVVLPKLYNGHDKSFFFFSYEELRDATPGAGFTTTVPTALERMGDFSKTFNTNGTLLTIYDPTTTQSVAAGGTYTCPNGTFTASKAGYYRCQAIYNGKLNVINPNTLNPVATALLAAYPLPNQAGVSGSDQNNFFSDAANTDHNYNFDVRLDHKFNDKQSVSGHADYMNNHILYGQVFGSPSLTPNNSNDFIPGRNIMAEHTWLLTPTLVFEQHYSWGHMESHRGSVDPLGTAPFGIPASATPGITATFTPQVEATSNQLGEIGNSEPLERNPNSVYQYAASISWLKGAHQFKFGVDLRRYTDQLYDPQLLTVNTSKSFTGGPYANSVTSGTGNAIAELLFGQATVTSGYAPRVNFRHGYYAGYAQDTWRVTRKLTATYGVRYSFEGADVSSGNLLTYLDTTDPSAIAGDVPSLPNLVGGVGVVGLNGSSRRLQTPQTNHFDPRLGIAFSATPKTVVHAGFGIFWHPTATYQTNPASFGYTRKSTSIDAGTNGFTPLQNLANPFPTGLPNVYTNNPSPLPGNNIGSGPLSIELGQSISGNAAQQSVPYQESWSVDVQQELPGRFVLTAAYAGNEGVHLYGALQLNQLTDAQLATGSALNAVVSNPFYNVITDSSSILSKSTIQAGYLLRPFPQFTNFEQLNSGYGHQNYQAGQFALEHRLSNGLSEQFSYTWSKSIDDIGESGTSATIQDIYCHRCERSVADLDQTNVVRLSTLYELPLGKDKAFVNQGLASRFAGGWQIGGTFQYTTGQPLSLTSPIQSASLNGGSVMRPTLVPGQSITAKVVNPTTGQLSSFNPAAFVQTGVYAFGNAPRYLSNVRYPAYSDLDGFVQKVTKINERYSFNLRFEALNALNTVEFGAPDTGVTDTNFGYNPRTQINSPRVAQISGRFIF